MERGMERKKPPRKAVHSAQILPAIIAILVWIAFLPVLNAEFVWDDRINLVDNFNYRGLGFSQIRWMLTTYHDGNYHPLSWLTFGLDYCLWGLNPSGYHLTNLVLHVINTVLVYHLISALIFISKPGPSIRSPRAVAIASFAGALFFGIHPLRVETVGWVSVRGDLVCAPFYLATLMSYLRYAANENSRCAGKWLILSLLFFALSLMGRAWGISLPFILLLLDVYPLKRLDMKGKLPGRVFKEKIPFFILSAIGALLAILAKSAGGKIVPLHSHSVFFRVLQACYSMAFYQLKTVWPFNLTPVYPLKILLNPDHPGFLSLTFAAVVITVLLFTWRNRWPWALCAWLSYAFIISPQLGFVQSGPQIAADRYSYIACLPFAVLFAAGVELAASGILSKKIGCTVLAATFALLAMFGFVTYKQAHVWQDIPSVWTNVIHRYPDYDEAHYNIGVYYLERGDTDRAADALDKALSLNPESSEATNQLGVVSMIRGNRKHALACFNRSIKLNPAYPEAYANRGVLRKGLGDPAGAASDFKTALAITKKSWRYRERVRNLLVQVESQLKQSSDKGNSDQ